MFACFRSHARAHARARKLASRYTGHPQQRWAWRAHVLGSLGNVPDPLLALAVQCHGGELRRGAMGVHMTSLAVLWLLYVLGVIAFGYGIVLRHAYI